MSYVQRISGSNIRFIMIAFYYFSQGHGMNMFRFSVRTVYSGCAVVVLDAGGLAWR